jgi:hypothetical protein
MFFVKAIQGALKEGQTVPSAIAALEAQRGSDSLPQLHRRLQPKGRKRKEPASAIHDPLESASSAV